MNWYKQSQNLEEPNYKKFDDLDIGDKFRSPMFGIAEKTGMCTFKTDKDPIIFMNDLGTEVELV